ncbi:peptidylprolyl isomerase [Alcaligenes nematophilus]|uniref:peptidylprolyl isomerase n=1 Tax=Alcaligenes nematophilus TaxID=2994643 RepID=UPI0034E05B34
MSRRDPHIVVRALVGVAVALALQAPAVLAAQGDSGPVATAGAVSVERQEVQALVTALPADRRTQLAQNPAALEQWVRTRLADKLLLAEASAQQWGTRPEVARQIEAATQEIVLRSYLASVSQVSSDYPTDVELTAAYNRVKNDLNKPASYRVSQVFIAAAIGDQAARADAQRTAAEVVRKARQPKADFAKLIAEYEKGLDAPAPDTGWVVLDQLLPEVRPVVASLKPGEVSEPVQSAAGLHVLKLVEARPAQPASFEEAKEALRARLRQERQGQIARAYLDGLANGAAVKVDAQAIKSILNNAGSSASTP